MDAIMIIFGALALHLAYQSLTGGMMNIWKYLILKFNQSDYGKEKTHSQAGFCIAACAFFIKLCMAKDAQNLSRRKKYEAVVETLINEVKTPIDWFEQRSEELQVIRMKNAEISQNIQNELLKAGNLEKLLLEQQKRQKELEQLKKSQERISGGTSNTQDLDLQIDKCADRINMLKKEMREVDESVGEFSMSRPYLMMYQEQGIKVHSGTMSDKLEEYFSTPGKLVSSGLNNQFSTYFILMLKSEKSGHALGGYVSGRHSGFKTTRFVLFDPNFGVFRIEYSKEKVTELVDRLFTEKYKGRYTSAQFALCGRV